MFNAQFEYYCCGTSFINLSMMNTIIISIFLLAAISILPNDAHNWISSMYASYRNNAKSFISEKEDFIRGLGSKYNLDKIYIAEKIEKLSSLRKQVLEDFERCHTSWEPDFGKGHYVTIPRNENQLEQCLRRVEYPFHRAVDVETKRVEYFIKHVSLVRNVDSSISQSEDFIKNLRSKYNLEENDVAPKIKELSLLKKKVLSDSDKCLQFWISLYSEFYLSLENDPENSFHLIKDSFHESLEMIKAEAEFSSKYYGWVKIMHGIISESNDFIKNLSRKYNPDENGMAPKLKELAFLGRQVREDLEGCFKLLVPDNGRGNTSGIKYQLDECFQRVGDSFKEAVKIVTEEAVFLSNSDCAFLDDDEWEDNFGILCANPQIRNAINQRIVDCMYLRVTNRVINSFEEEGLNKIVPKEINNCHRKRFSELSRKLVYLKTRLFRLRASSFDKLNNISSRNNKCSPGDIVKLDGFHPLATKLCSQFYNYIQSENEEYEECSNNKKD